MRGNTWHHAISRSFTSPARDDHIAALSESPPAAGGTEFSKEPRDVEPNGDGGDASVSDACAEGGGLIDGGSAGADTGAVSGSKGAADDLCGDAGVVIVLIGNATLPPPPEPHKPAQRPPHRL